MPNKHPLFGVSYPLVLIMTPVASAQFLPMLGSAFFSLALLL